MGTGAMFPTPYSNGIYVRPGLRDDYETEHRSEHFRGVRSPPAVKAGITPKAIHERT